MLLRPWFLHYRRQIIIAAMVSLAAVLLVLFMTSAESLTDIGVLWHHFCGCPLDPDDTRLLLNFGFSIPSLLGIIFGVSSIPARTAITAPGGGEVRFLLTRPVPRWAILLCPAVVATIAMAIFPTLGFLLLFGWLRLVHAPSLGHIVGLIELLPSARNLGPHPSLLSVLGSIHFFRRYLAGISIGLCWYTLMVAQRWLLLSSNKWIKAAGSVPLFILCFPFLRLFGKWQNPVFFLTSGHTNQLTYLPSMLAIALHLAFVTAILYGYWRILRTAEL